MHGSLALKNGVLWVARYGAEATVAAFDLDGHKLGPGFGLGTRESGAPQVTGLALDDDHSLWLADARSQKVRAFSVFGVEGEAIVHEYLGGVSDVAVRGEDDERQLWVASSGMSHGNVLLFDSGGECTSSLRSMGDPAVSFRDIAGLALGEHLSYVCERRGARVQVFRDAEFHFAFGLDSDPRFEPSAVAALSDERVLVTTGGRQSGLHLFDAAGRHLQCLADTGTDMGQLFEPSDVVTLEGADDRHTRVVVIDCDGDRVQVFSLAGRCYGAFTELDE